jgi:hypothetical protein
MVRMGLSNRQLAILEFERTWWTMDGEKETLIRRRFACAPDAYYEELNQVLEDPEALVADPLVVRRLMRLRDRRLRARLDGPGTEASAK